jgi:hypothetical protein
VTKVNASDGSFVQNLSGGSYNFSLPDGVAFDGLHVWVSNPGNNSLTELTTGGSFVRNLSGAPFNFSSPVALAFTPVRPPSPPAISGWSMRETTP